MVMAESSRFGFMELLVFVSALVAGTCCSLCSKVMMQMSSANMEKEYQKFSSPLFQTLVMFIGMMIGLVLHIAVVLFRVPFPGYSHSFHKNTERGTPFWVYFALFIPSVFDLGATAFCMAGLRYVNVSVYQMLRGGAVVFVACFKHFLLRKQLKTFMWIGVLLNVVAIGLTGSSAVLSAKENHSESVRSHISHEDINTSGDSGAGSGSLGGVLLILVGAFLQGLQYVTEEWLMSAELGLSAVPPVLLIGMEGLWGTILCLGVAYPIVYALPGPDHGSFENLQNTLVMVANSSSIQLMVIVYTMSIFVYNLLGCLVTYMLSAVWHAILDNFRPVTIWMTDLCIFYVPIWLHMAPAKSQLLRAAGEQWLNWSFLQLLGMVVLFYGTAVYNAPNPGSIQLTGGLGSLFLDCSKEYEEIVATQSATSTSTDSDGASCSDSDDAVTHRAAVDSALSISLPSQRSLEILSYNGARRQQRQCYNDETTLLITRQEGRSSHVQDSLLPRTHP